MPPPSEKARAEAEWFEALAEPTRLAILRALAAGAKSVTDLAEACGIPQARVSHHIAVLERTGLITVKQDGRFHRCSLVGAVSAAGIELASATGSKVVLPLG